MLNFWSVIYGLCKGAWNSLIQNYPIQKKLFEILAQMQVNLKENSWELKNYLIFFIFQKCTLVKIEQKPTSVISKIWMLNVKPNPKLDLILNRLLKLGKTIRETPRPLGDWAYTLWSLLSVRFYLSSWLEFSPKRVSITLTLSWRFSTWT